MGKREETKKMTKKQKFLKSMQIPISSVRLCVSDDIRVELEGCTGIIIYDENEVKLAAGKLEIGFIGSNLQITQYDSRMTVIEGIINTVSYERG